MHLLQVPRDGSSPNLKIGIHNKPEKSPRLTVSAVQHTSSSAFFPLCDGSYSIKHSVCLPQFIRVRRGHLLSRYVLGTAVLWDLHNAESPCFAKYLLIKSGRVQPQRQGPYFMDIMDIKKYDLLLQRASQQGCYGGFLGASFPDGKCFRTRHDNVILPHIF